MNKTEILKNAPQNCNVAGIKLISVNFSQQTKIVRDNTGPNYDI